MKSLAERRAGKVKAGLCRDCPAKRAHGRKFCSRCLKKIKQRNDDRYQKLRGTNTCVWCGINPAVDGIHCVKCRRRQRINVSRWWLKNKLNVFNAYGGSVCACCKETKIEFLTIDHIHGGGTKHRAEIAASGSSFYRWLIVNNFPKGFRVLCANCNFSLGHFGYCPHKRKR